MSFLASTDESDAFPVKLGRPEAHKLLRMLYYPPPQTHSTIELNTIVSSFTDLPSFRTLNQFVTHKRKDFLRETEIQNKINTLIDSLDNTKYS
jgi:hypothetical protein